MEHCNVPPKILSKFLGRSDLKSKAIQIFRSQPLPWPTLPPPAPRPCPGPPIIINPASLLQPTSSPGHHSHKQILTKRTKYSQVTLGGRKSILDVQRYLFLSWITKLPRESSVRGDEANLKSWDASMKNVWSRPQRVKGYLQRYWGEACLRTWEAVPGKKTLSILLQKSWYTQSWSFEA